MKENKDDFEYLDTDELLSALSDEFHSKEMCGNSGENSDAKDSQSEEKKQQGVELEATSESELDEIDWSKIDFEELANLSKNFAFFDYDSDSCEIGKEVSCDGVQKFYDDYFDETFANLLADDEDYSNEICSSTDDVRKKKRRKRIQGFPLNFASINCGVKWNKKISKKFVKDTAKDDSTAKTVMQTSDEIKCISNAIGTKDNQNTNEPSEIKAPKFFLRNPQKRTKKIIIEMAKTTDIEKSQKSNETIQDKSGKLTQKTPSNTSGKPTQKSKTKHTYSIRNAHDEGKSDEELSEIEALRQENFALKKALFADKKRNFFYAEILSNKSSSERQKDKELVLLREAQARERAQRKQQEQESKEREDKIHDIIRQKKDVQYDLDYIRRKAEWWRKKSDEAYRSAMLSAALNCGNSTNLSRLGLDSYGRYMALSIMAMQYSLEYQKNLEEEREKILEKERKLDSLMQR